VSIGIEALTGSDFWFDGLLNERMPEVFELTTRIDLRIVEEESRDSVPLEL